MSSQFRRNGHLFTSESVTMGHPDKVSDQISDAILDAILAEQTRVNPGNLASTRVAVGPSPRPRNATSPITAATIAAAAPSTA